MSQQPSSSTKTSSFSRSNNKAKSPTTVNTDTPTSSDTPIDIDTTPPSSLFSKHLQPSPPPPSAANLQIKLFKRVIDRRSSQLQSFSLLIHQKLFKSLTSTTSDTAELDTACGENNNGKNPTFPAGSPGSAGSRKTRNSSGNTHKIPVTSSEINQLLSKLPEKKPTSNRNHYTSLILYLLTENFNNSCDSRLSATERTSCLNKVRFILYRVEVALELHNKQKKKEKEEKEERLLIERAKVAKDKLLQKARVGDFGGRLGSKSNNNSTMGSLMSKSTAGNNNSGKNKENEIIILDDDDDDDEDIEDIEEKNATTTTTAATATTTTATTAAAATTTTTSRSSSNTNKVKSSISPLPPQSVNNETTATTTTAAQALSGTFAQSTKIPPSQEYVSPYKTEPRLYLTHNSIIPPQGVPTALLFLADSKLSNNSAVNYTASYSIFERSRCQLTFNMAFESCRRTIDTMRQHPIPPPPPLAPNYTQFSPNFSSIYLDGHALDGFESRLRRWDPYWDVVYDCSQFETRNPNGDMVHIGYKTTLVNESRLDRPMQDKNEEPRTASLVPLEFSGLDTSDHKIKWGQKPMNKSNSYANDEKRLIVRTLPLIPNPKYEKIRSDTHQWPKGTFLQIGSRPIYPIHQRKQQQHDPMLWKGLSEMFDLTEFISPNELVYKQRNKLRINLQMCAKDGEMYGIQVAVCKHISPDELFNICMSSGTRGSIAKMDYKDGLKHAMKHFEKETLVLDSDSDDDDDDATKTDATTNGASGATGPGSKQIQSMKCSLICPVTMQVIQTPVRGTNCKHSSCFDLRTFLQSNSKVSGGRWRCFICEDFISLDQLVYDGFIAQVLETHKNDINTTSRDKVQLSNDGTWTLVNEASSSVRRNQKKRKMQEQGGSDAKKISNPPAITEIIDIDD